MAIPTGPTKVEFSKLTHYIVSHPKNRPSRPRHFVVAKGRCDGIEFEATAINEPDFSTKLDLFHVSGGKFEKYEQQSIGNRIKMSPPLEVVDLRETEVTIEYSDLRDPLVEKYLGGKVYYRVIYERRKEAAKIGAEWDPLAKKWFVRQLSPDLKKMDERFRRH